MELRVDRGHWPERLRRLEEAGWRVVPDEDYARTPGRQMVLNERFISCHLPLGSKSAGLFFNSVERDFGSADFPTSLTSWFAVTRCYREPFNLLIDMRRLVLVADRFTPLMHHAESSMASFFNGVLRVCMMGVVVVLPADTSKHFWAGLMPQFVEPKPVFVESLDEAWSLTEATPEERLACERAADIAFGNSDPSTAEQVARRLDLEPGLELAAVAKALGLSPRSLQRRLTEEGIRFAALRDEARLRRANALVEAGAKVEAIAREVGFASTSHFIQWYRVRTQRTPGGRGRRSTSPRDEA